TASRSASINPVLRPLARTSRRGRFCAAPTSLRKASEVARASALRSPATESSRSRISASAPLSNPLASFRGLSPGTNKRERIAMTLLAHDLIRKPVPTFRDHALSRPHAHVGLAAAFGDELAVLIEAAVQQVDDAGLRARFRLALAEHFRAGVDGV